MALEWYIVQYLVFWLLFLGLPTSERSMKKNAGSLVVFSLNWAAVACMSLWLYWVGYDLGSKEGCDVSVFLFTTFSAYNSKWILANKVISVFGVVLVWLPFGLAVMLFGLAVTKWNEDDLGSDNDDDDDLIKIGIRIGNALLVGMQGVIPVAFTEMTVKVNHIEFPDVGMSDSSQLIPLIIGVCTLVSVLWEGLRNGLRLLQ